MISFRAEVERRTRAAYRMAADRYDRDTGWRAWCLALLRAQDLHPTWEPAADVATSSTFSSRVDTAHLDAQSRGDAEALRAELQPLALDLSADPSIRANLFIWAFEAWQHAQRSARASQGTTNTLDVAQSTQLFTDTHLAEQLWAPVFVHLQTLDDAALRAVRILDPCSGASAVLRVAFRALVPTFSARFGWSTEQSITHVLTHTLRGVEIDPVCADVGALVLAMEAYALLQRDGLEDDPLAWARVARLPSPVAHTSFLRADGSICATFDFEGGSVPDCARFQSYFGSLYDADRHPTQVLRTILPSGSSSLPVAGVGMSAETAETAETTASATRFVELVASFPLATPRGQAAATEFLHAPTHHICTNVPFLGRGKQPTPYRDFCATFYPDSRHDLANVFLARCLEIVASTAGRVHVLMPQNWLFLRSYVAQRKTLLDTTTWERLEFLPEGAFHSAGAAGAFVILLHLRAKAPNDDHCIEMHRSQDAGFAPSPVGALQQSLLQRSVRATPDARVVWALPSADLPPLSDVADAFVGLQTGDDPRYIQPFWAFETPDPARWQPLQNTPTDFAYEDGNSWLVRWDEAAGPLHAASGARPDQGHAAVGKEGIAIQRMRRIFAYDYSGTRFHQNIAVIVPKDPKDLPAIRAFCHAPAFEIAVRQLDQKLNVTNRTLTRVPFDRAHWAQEAKRPSEPVNKLTQNQGVATQKEGSLSSPNRNPHPFRQRGFTGYGPAPYALHIHLARHLGMRWPTELPISDGITSGTPPWRILLHPAPHAPRGCTFEGWRDALLRDAPEDLHLQIAMQDQSDASLQVYLRDRFFKEHCSLFLSHPFLWHIWDGEPDGFSVIVRYHRLCARGVIQLIDDVSAWQDLLLDPTYFATPCPRRTDAAQRLKRRLRDILAGVPPYDLHIRWKAPKAQPRGWALDLDDGIRVHLRPWLSGPSFSRKGAGVLRHRPKVHFGNDRGRDPADGPWAERNLKEGLPAGARVNDRHRTR